MTARRVVSPLAPREGDPRIYSVAELVGELKGMLQNEYPRVVVQGEVTDYKGPSQNGHCYFKLKDGQAQLQVALFARQARTLGIVLQNGMAVQAEGELTVYAARGDLQLVAERVAPVGFGALQAQLEALKRKLHAEGLFAVERKRPLPRYPTHVGIVTSPSGAALGDMLRILRQHAPYATVTVAPVRVQGVGAAQEIAAAIALMNEWGRPHVLIVGRGGGSVEDLWTFNEEIVVRAIARSRIPVVSAVGHEGDTTLADLVADERVATPTHAARRVALDKDEACQALLAVTKHARDRLLREIQRERRHLQGLRTHRALREPHRRIAEGYQTVDDARDRLARALAEWVVMRRRRIERMDGRVRAYAPGRMLERYRERLHTFEHRAARCTADTIARARSQAAEAERLLGAYDYRGVLRRGYALVWTEDRQSLVNRARALRPDQTIQVQFDDARARARVLQVDARSEEETT